MYGKGLGESYSLCCCAQGLGGLIVAVSLSLAHTVCLINGYLWPFWPLEKLLRKYIFFIGLGTKRSGKNEWKETHIRVCESILGQSASMLGYIHRSVGAYF